MDVKKIFSKNPLKQGYFFIFALFLTLIFVAGTAWYKTKLKPKNYIYVKAKLSQGLWWASTKKPNFWFIKALETLKGKTGEITPKVLQVRYYPWEYTDEYNIYITLKIKADKSSKGKYFFKRSPIGVGSPIELEFPSVQFSATVIDIAPSPFPEKYTVKTVVLVKENAYKWEYDAIKKGDYYFDGEEKVLEILDKWKYENKSLLKTIQNTYTGAYEDTYNIFTKVRLKGKLIQDTFIWGEEQIIKPGKIVNLQSQNFTFLNFRVVSIED